MPTDNYSHREPKRRAEFIKPPNTLKRKVGAGGLSDDILNKAQALLENNTVDFTPLAELYLGSLMKGVERIKQAPSGADPESLLAGIIYPAMQLKANGGMFHYPLVTEISAYIIHFLERVDEPDLEVVEIVLAFHTTIRAVVLGKIRGDGGKHGKALLKALSEACTRYFEKYRPA